MMTLPPAPFKRGWLKGSRRTFLEQHLDAFRLQRRLGKSVGREYIDGVFNSFCVAYPWWLGMKEEPNPSVVYSEEDLPATVLEHKGAALARLTKGIQNFFERSWTKAEPINKMTKTQISKNPVAALLAKVGDVKFHRLRGRTVEQMFSSETFSSIRTDFNEAFAETGKDGRRERLEEAAKRVRKDFQELPEDEWKYWEKRAKEDAEEVAQGKAEFASLPDRLGPEATQEALDGLANTMQPLLEGLSALLGGNVSFFWAGPEPAKGGQVNVVSLHVGSDKSAIPQTFATAGGDRGKCRRKMAEACMGEFAMECFSYAEQEARALPNALMPGTLPAFMRQPIPWNVAGGELSVECPSEMASSQAPLLALPSNSGVSTVSESAVVSGSKKRKRQTKEKSRKQARRHKEDSASGTDDDDSDDENNENNENIGSRSRSPPLTRSQGKQPVVPAPVAVQFTKPAG